jgi:hypothetical protein
MYHYVLTRDYPYTLGCFRGRPVSSGRPGGGLSGMGPGLGPPGPAPGGMAGGMGPAGGRRRPPAEAIAACVGQNEGASCTIVTPRGNRLGGRCFTPGDTLACLPDRR